jgi:MFS family permease
MRLNWYKTYLLIVLMTILAFSYVDRMVFGLVLEYVKADLNVTDTQMGVVGGIGFALFFAVIGIPIARWGDRVAIISLTTAVWIVAVVLWGVAGGFLQLFLVRIGVAAGEVGFTALASSFIPEYFSRTGRKRAAARCHLGPMLTILPIQMCRRQAWPPSILNQWI